jgi:hypothetical protein
MLISEDYMNETNEVFVKNSKSMSKNESIKNSCHFELEEDTLLILLFKNKNFQLYYKKLYNNSDVTQFSKLKHRDKFIFLANLLLFVNKINLILVI